MHKIFTVEDVVAQICYVLLKEDHDRSSVARLARVNKAISIPCFAALWRTLDCIYPLLKALPSSVIDLSDRWRLLRNPTLADWSRPLFYGAFVRSLSYDPQPYNIHRSLLYDLLASLHIQPGHGPSPWSIQLLPNLTHSSITWKLAIPESFIAYKLFCSPALLSATLICAPDPIYALEHQHRFLMAEWLGALQSRCPLLEEIHMQTRWAALMGSPETVNIRTSFPHFPSLLAMTAITPGIYAVRFILATSKQPRLKRLYLKFTAGAVMPPPFEEGSYPSLETLELEGYNQKCAEFLAILAPHPPPHLTSLTLTCLSLEQPTEEFFKTVARSVPSQTLRSLTVSFHPNYEPTARTTLNDLSPLFVFDELRELKIQAGNPFQMNSAALETIGAAFRELRVLCLNSPTEEEDDVDTDEVGTERFGSTFSWSGVMGLARTCPLLNELSLPIDFDSLPAPTFSPRSSTDHSNTSSAASSSTPRHRSFSNLESFLLNDIPPSSHSLYALPPLVLPTSNAQYPPTPLSLSSSSALSPASRRSVRNSILNPQYAVLVMLVERVFPRAKLGLHSNRFEEHEKDQRRERFERAQMRASGGRRVRKLTPR